MFINLENIFVNITMIVMLAKICPKIIATFNIHWSHKLTPHTDSGTRLDHIPKQFHFKSCPFFYHVKAFTIGYNFEFGQFPKS